MKAIVFLVVVSLGPWSFGAQEDIEESVPYLGEFDEYAVQFMSDHHEQEKLGLAESEIDAIDELLAEMGIAYPIPAGRGLPGDFDMQAARRAQADEFMARVSEIIPPEAYRQAIRKLNYRELRHERDERHRSDETRILSPKLAQTLEVTDVQVGQIETLIVDYKSNLKVDLQSKNEQVAARAQQYRDDFWDLLPMDVAGSLTDLIGEPAPWTEFTQLGHPFLCSGPLTSNCAPSGSSLLSMVGRVPSVHPPSRDFDLFQYGILVMPGLRQELQLSESVEQEVIEYVESLDGGAFFDSRFNDMLIDKLMDGTRGVPIEIKGLLEPEQLERFFEIELQLRLGYTLSFGMLNPRIIDQLDLSDELQERLQAKVLDFESMAETFSTEGDDARRALRLELIEATLAVLTPEQREMYFHLVGDTAREKVRR